jgi:hypothetical protein
VSTSRTSTAAVVAPALWLGCEDSLPILAALIADSALFLGNDTGAMHLAAALDVVRTDGFILYATCSISEEENDAVVGRLLERRSGRVELVRPEWSSGEATEHGQALLPDATGEGPMYAALLRRLS